MYFVRGLTIVSNHPIRNSWSI